MPVGFDQWFFTPADHGYLGATGFPTAQSQSLTLSNAGVANLARIKVPQAGLCTNIVFYVVTAGSGLTAGQNFAALYTAAGTLIAQSADQSTNWAGTGAKNAVLGGGPYYLPVAEYYVAFWYNGTTGPTLHRNSGSVGAVTNNGRSAPNLLAATADSGLTTAAPTTLGAQTVLGSYFLVALS